MRLLVVSTSEGDTANQSIALEDLVGRGHTIESLDIPSSGLPRRAGRSAKRTGRAFKYTPEPLIESWRVARHVHRGSGPGDVVVVSDREGIGGILALEEATRPQGERRRMWTIAGDGLFLRSMLIAGTTDGVDEFDRSAIDWELVQYRYSEHVFATSRAAVDVLRAAGVSAELLTGPRNPHDRETGSRGTGVWAPGSVSRRNRSGDVMRAVASVPDLELTVSNSDVDDRIWSGSTWDALSGIRSILGERLERGDRPSERPSCVVVADALVPPDGPTTEWRSSGIPVLAVAGSVASAMWPEAATWRTTDDLVALLRGRLPDSSPSTVSLSPHLISRTVDEQRARRVSVGVPIFGSTDYLDECINSIMEQSQVPHEVLLIDDGSLSANVDAALSAWTVREPEMIRVLQQSNRGVCVARNRMIESMTGDAFLLIDQDDVLEVDFIQRTAEALRQDNSLWAVAAWTEFFGDYEGIEAKPPFDRRVGLRENPIVSTAALVDMRVRDEGIHYEPDMAFLYCEDWHYWSQIIGAGGQMGLVPKPLIRHRVHQASGGFQRTELAHRIGKARAIEPLLSCPSPPG